MIKGSPLIRGRVTRDGKLEIGRGPLDICVDTGFTGDLLLPGSVLRQLKLRYVGAIDYKLANGIVQTVDQWKGWIVVAGRDRKGIFMEGDTLLGMDLLKNTCRTLSIDFRSGAVALALR